VAALAAAGLLAAGLFQVNHDATYKTDPLGAVGSQQPAGPKASGHNGRSGHKAGGKAGRHNAEPGQGSISARPSGGHASGGAHVRPSGKPSSHPRASRKAPKPVSKPAAPAAIRMSGNRISWTAVDTRTAAASAYRVTFAGAVDGQRYRYSLKTVGTSVRIPMLPRGRSYAVRVVATNALGRAARSTRITLPFRHPGILVANSQLAFLKRKVQSGAQPWASAFASVVHQRYTSSSYRAHPASTLSRRGGSAKALESDDIAAYTNALAYYITGNTAYGDRAVSILNSWARTMHGVARDAQLDAVWASEVMPRAAEIIRSSYRPARGHAALDVAALNRLFKYVLLPQNSPNSDGYRWSNGNWGASMADGTINIGVFLRDTSTFDRGVREWRQRVRSYMYLSSDGPTPIAPPGGAYNTAHKVNCFWANKSTNCSLPKGWHVVNHQVQETCRDMNHTVLGSEALMQAAETARTQGVDLFGQEASRIVGAYEFTAKHDLEALANGGRVSGGVCGGRINQGGIGWQTGFVTAYNAYHNRLGYSMPYTKQMMDKIAAVTHKPVAGLVAALDVAWTGLTNLGTP
jgi:Alginate lyase